MVFKFFWGNDHEFKDFLFDFMNIGFELVLNEWLIL